MKRLSIFLILSLLLFTTCVEPVNVNLGEPVKRLVVDGMITTKPGPYTIKLTTTAKYSVSSEGTNFLLKGATVRISDDTGYNEQLTEVSSGIYRTNANGIQGQVGRTYTLHIETEGKQYQSVPELLRATTGVENVSVEFKYEAPGVKEGFYVYVDTKDPVETEDFYRWNWVHYARETICFNDIVPPGTQPTVLDCCGNCWNIYGCNGCVNIASDVYANGTTISRQLLAIAPYTSRSKYFLYYEQFSLSKDAYKFWKGLDQQINNVGGIFDAPPAIIRGNMFNVADEDEIVLGFFGASDVKPGFVNIDRSGIPKPPNEPPPVMRPPLSGPPPPCYPCIESIIRTPNTPPLWQD
ncbi:DUF4249 domain-containing protein [Rhodocytophaga rosea]|uniref:DUF4249 domain-containing protein n=1 Tax=Rhodocytophaga rosea TaxID=2704465 RepID=A0A6C0GIZ0_9BACT|nr:DUF4249 domain-containing protein [Rhodocytophaga rosea]QHT67680.1 DUF4249 domain-containing protein [Rhodocytophaga rosea]